MITVEQLSKTIGNKVILSNISFEVAEGDCVALIGPNGAGKTTLMSCLLGDRKASQGSVLLDGQTPTASANKASVAVLPQDNTIPNGLTVAELIAFFRAIYPQALSLEEVRQLLQFSPKQEKQLAEKLSGGQRRLLAFVLCLIGKPKLLFLDEPTAGMDTSTRQRFWEIIQNLKAAGVTICYTSHYIEEVEHTADRILVLHKGQLLRDTTPFAMRQEEQEKHLTLPLAFLEAVQGLSGIDQLKVKQDRLICVTKDIETVWQGLMAKGCTISDVEIQNKTLLNSLFDQTKEDKSWQPYSL